MSITITIADEDGNIVMEFPYLIHRCCGGRFQPIEVSGPDRAFISIQPGEIECTKCRKVIGVSRLLSDEVEVDDDSCPF